MKLKLNSIIIFLLAITFNSVNYAQSLKPYQAIDYSIDSETLKDNRKGKVYMPKESENLITFYVLDGEWNFDYVKSTIDLYRRWNRIPDVRIVSIVHKNRTSDLTPTPDQQRFPGSGNAENFKTYIKKELMPYINKIYGNSSQDFIFGHSFGGLFAIDVLTTAPNLFDGYIAVSPSTWWKDDYLFNDSIKQNLDASKDTPFIYISTAEFDSGNTKPSNERYVTWLDSLIIGSKIKVHFEVFENENHFTNIARSFQDALNKIFPGPEFKDKIEEIYTAKGLTGIQEWYAQKQIEIKERMILPEDEILGLAVNLIRSQKNAEATNVLKWLLQENPESGNGYYYLGYNEAQASHKDKARTAYKSALNMELPERIKTVIRKSLAGLTTPNQNEAKVVLPGIISTDAVETAIAFTQTQDTYFFVRHEGSWGSQDNPPSNIYVTKKRNGEWTRPELASFSDPKYNDTDVFVDVDNSIYFASNRPYKGKTGADNDIWKLDFKNGNWMPLKPLSSVINTEASESSPVTDKFGNLYFVSTRQDGKGLGDIYFAEKNPDGTLGKPQIIIEVSTKYGEWNVFVNPESTYMIFESSGRPNSKSPYGDFYFSRKSNGKWQTPKLVEILNTTGSDLNVRLSPDSEYLYYASSKYLENKSVNIFKIKTNLVLEGLK